MAKVRRKKTDKESMQSNLGALGDLPTLAQSIEMKEMTNQKIAQAKPELLSAASQMRSGDDLLKAKTTPFKGGNIPAQRPTAMKQMETKTTPFKGGNIPSQAELESKFKGGNIPTSKSVKVSRKRREVPPGSNIYDERIGGYGTARRDKNGMWLETGEEAIRRILNEREEAKAKVKVKKKR